MTISRDLPSGVHGLTGLISHESIYRGIYTHGTRGMPTGLDEGLQRRRRCRKHRHRGGQPAEKKSPHWASSIQSPAVPPSPPSAPKSATWKGPDHRRPAPLSDRHHVRPYLSPPLADRLLRGARRRGHRGHALRVLGAVPEHFRRTLTCDQEREMARYAELFGIDIYFCDPHCGGDRPTRTATGSSAAPSARAPTCPATPPPICVTASSASAPCPVAASIGQSLTL